MTQKQYEELYMYLAVAAATTVCEELGNIHPDKLPLEVLKAYAEWRELTDKH